MPNTITGSRGRPMVRQMRLRPYKDRRPVRKPYSLGQFAVVRATLGALHIWVPMLGSHLPAVLWRLADLGCQCLSNSLQNAQCLTVGATSSRHHEAFAAAPPTDSSPVAVRVFSWLAQPGHLKITLEGPMGHVALHWTCAKSAADGCVVGRLPP